VASNETKIIRYFLSTIAIVGVILSWTHWYYPAQQEYDTWFRKGSCFVQDSLVFANSRMSFSNNRYTPAFSVKWTVFIDEQNTLREIIDYSENNFNEAMNEYKKFLPDKMYDCYWDDREPFIVSWTSDIMNPDFSLAMSIVITIASILVILVIWSNEFT